MEDITLGRETISSQNSITANTVSQPAVPASGLRVSLFLVPPLAGTLTYSLAPTAVAGTGIILVAGSLPLNLTIETHGALVKMSWSVVADAGGRVATWYDTILMRK